MAEEKKKDKKPSASSGDSFWGVFIAIILIGLAINRTEWGQKFWGTNATSTATSTFDGTPPPDKPTVIIGQ